MGFLFISVALFVAAVVLVVPALAGAALYGRRQEADFCGALAAALVGVAFFGWVTFLAAMAGLIPGLIAVALLLIGCGFIIWQRLNDIGFRQSSRVLLSAWGVCFAVSCVVCTTGFLFGGFGSPLETAAIRFSHALPGDNQLPFLVAEGLRAGEMPRPLFADWLSSDRPPLQTGIYLAVAGWWPGDASARSFHYQIVSVFAQSLCLIGVLAFMLAACAARLAIIAAVIGVVFTGFFFVHAFFVWPKLLAAAFGMIIAAFALTSWPDERREHTKSALIVGAAAAFSMLSHGAAIFAIFGFGLMMLARVMLGAVKFPSIRFIAIALVTAVVLYAPWTAYQKWYDPGGNRLLKFHLAGVEGADSAPLGDLLKREYGRIGWSGALQQKLANVKDAVTLPTAGIFPAAESAFLTISGEQVGARAAAESSRTAQFFFFGPAIGLFALGPIFLAIYAWRRRVGAPSQDVAIAAINAWGAAILGMLVWAIIVFDRPSVVLHVGGFALVLVAICASTLAASALSRWLPLCISAANAVLFAFPYILYTPASPVAYAALDHSASPGMLIGAVFALALLVGFGLDLVRVLDGQRERGAVRQTTA